MQEKAENGAVLGLTTPDGKRFPAKIQEVNEDEIILDLDHPMAGQNLNFEIEIKKVEKKKD